MPFPHTPIRLLACVLFAWLACQSAQGGELNVEPLPPLAESPPDYVLASELASDYPALTDPRFAPTHAAAPPSDCRTWQVLPDGLMYKSYLAGVREPRFASQWMSERTEGGIWDIALGGRVSIVRYGTQDPSNPEGTELQMEGAAFPRLDLDNNSDLIACDYRFGLPVAIAEGRHHYKIGYYHISSHLGDEWLLRYRDARRINYGRDAMVAGYSFYPTPDWRLYGETAYSFGAGDFTEPWEFQFGVEYSPAAPTGLRPVPFVAVGGHLREEVDFGGNVVVQSGWQWRGTTGHLLRMGMQCYVGMSEQYEFFDQYESKLGLGIWYDY